MLRSLRLLSLLAIGAALPAFAQDAGTQEGAPFSRTNKSLPGDLHLVTGGTVDAQGAPILLAQEGLVCKAVRLGTDLAPAEEVSLAQQAFDGAKWDAVCGLPDASGYHILLVSNTKKTADLGIATLTTDGPLALADFHRVGSFPEPCTFDPGTTTCRKTLPDLILFDNGAFYDQQERLVRSPNGQHYLVNYYTHDKKGNKKFWYICLDKELRPEWSGEKELPFEDVNSDVHEISIDDDGRILVLTYVFTCGTPDRASDKLCHEVHLTLLSDQGVHMKDLLLDKDFVSSARILPRPGGRVLMAMRYGALTGEAGALIALDSAVTKLKPTPLVDQRVPVVHKTKLTPFGMPATDNTKKPAGGSRNAKVPDEVVELLPAWDGGVLLVEGFRDPEMQVPMGDATAIRQLHGALRVSYLDARDSVRWQTTVDRLFLTTAGEAYGSAGLAVAPNGILLVFNTTPGGLTAINASYAGLADEGKKKSKEVIVEPSELHAAWIDKDGKLASNSTLATPSERFTYCPMTLVTDAAVDNAWLKGYDRGTQHRYVHFHPAH